MTAAVVSAAKPCTGCIFTILWPMVRMMRYPPAAVPAAIVAAHSSTTQNGMSLNSVTRRKLAHSGRSLKAPVVVPVKSASVMMPIVFWASLEPWLKPMKPALSNWALPKIRPTIRGVTLRRTIVSSVIRMAPPIIPAKGDVNIGRTTLGQRPMAAPFLSCACQMRTDHCPPPVARAAPQRPPISA